MSSQLDLNILKVLVTNKKHALDFAHDADAKLFSADIWTFANLVVNYVKTYKDVPTLRILTEKVKNDIFAESIKKIWSQLDQINYDDREFKHDLEKLKKRYAERQLVTAKENLNKFEPGLEDVALNKVMSDLQKTLQNIRSLHQIKTYERKTLKDSIPSFRDEYNAKMDNPAFDSGIRTGYSFLDYVTDGLRAGEMLLIGGESGGGKSMLLMNMAIQMWQQENTIDMDESQFGKGNSVLYFSLEMPFKPCLNRVLSRISGNPSKKIRQANLNVEEAGKLKKSLKFINKYSHQFEIVDIPRGATMESLELIYEEAKATYDPKIIVIDYLGLMEYEGENMEDWLKLGKIAEKVHEFARVHNVIVLSAVQLNRKGNSKSEEDKVGLHRIGRSALIMQNANIAIQIESRPNEKNYPDMIYHIIKNRDGALGKSSLIKNLACGTLLDNKMPEEDDTFFEERDPDDISEKIKLLDIDI